MAGRSSPFGGGGPSRLTGDSLGNAFVPSGTLASERVGDVLQRPRGNDGRTYQAAARKEPGQARFGG